MYLEDRHFIRIPLSLAEFKMFQVWECFCLQLANCPFQNRHSLIKCTLFTWLPNIARHYLWSDSETIPRSTYGRDCIYNVLSQPRAFILSHCNGRFIQKDAEAIWTTEENAHSNWCVFPLLTQPKHVWVIYLSIIFTCYFQHNEALQCTFENHRHSNSGPPFSSTRYFTITRQF